MLPGERTESNEYKILENLKENFVFQHVTIPTRWRGTIDLILTIEEQMISNWEYKSPLGNSDHFTMKLDFNSSMNIKRSNKKYIFSRGNNIKIKEELDKINWIELLQNETILTKTRNHFWVQFKI